MRIISVFTACAALAACATASAPPDPAPMVPPNGLSQNAPGGVPVLIPEGQRGGAMIIVPGAVMTVALDSKLRIAAVMNGQAPASLPFERMQLDRDKETLGAVRGDSPLETPSDRLEFTLWSDERNGTVLMVKNGERKPMAYIAALVHGPLVRENFKLTTTCSVPAGKVGFEGWHERIDGVAIIAVIEPPESDDVICVDPTKNMEDPRWYALEQ